MINAPKIATSTIVFEVWTAVSHVEAIVIAVAGGVVGVHDDRVEVGLGHPALRVLALAALLRLPAASHQAGHVPGRNHEEQTADERH